MHELFLVLLTAFNFWYDILELCDASHISQVLKYFPIFHCTSALNQSEMKNMFIILA